LEEVRQQFLDDINNYRTNRGLTQLELKYSSIAQAHADRQAQFDRFLAHKGFDQRADHIMDLLKQDHGKSNRLFGFVSVAENCCYFPICPEPSKKALQQFLSSPSHWRNLLKGWSYTAIGIAQGESGHFYVCQLFF